MSRPGPGVRQPLLLLCHRIPYPPDKGDKIRSFHLLEYLAREYEVYLGAFVDDSADWQHREALNRHCRAVMLRPLSPTRAKLASVSGLVRGEPLTLAYYRDKGLQRWVDEVVERAGIRRVVVFSSAMGQFVPAAAGTSVTTVVDFVDVDSAKWAQYAARKSWPLSWLYRREGRCLARYENSLSRRVDASVFVSREEAALYCQHNPDVAARVSYYRNGVDTDYFDPRERGDSPYPHGILPLVFTGAMDYWPNIDAVTWFSRQVLPLVRRQRPEAVFYIVGTRPSRDVRALARDGEVVVTGRVADMRPWLGHARVAVAPVRVAQGIQNKVLEAMAMGRPLVVTARALEGIAATAGEQLLLADDADTMAARILALLDGEYPTLGEAARALVREHFSWEASLPLIGQQLEGGPAEARQPALGAAHG